MSEHIATHIWQWPVNLHIYDRTPYLHHAEQQELDQVIQQFDSPGSHAWSPLTNEVLARLTHPLYDVLAATGAGGKIHGSAVSLLLRQMQSRRTPFWAWGTEEWSEILCPSFQLFKQKHHSSHARQDVLAIAYLLCGFADLTPLGVIQPILLARKIFGIEATEAAIQHIQAGVQELGYGPTRAKYDLPSVVCLVLLHNRSPRLEDITSESLAQIAQAGKGARFTRDLVAISSVLATQGLLAHPLVFSSQEQGLGNKGAWAGVASEWLRWCQRWHDTSTLAPQTRKVAYYHLLKVGRWLNEAHPEISSPQEWTRELAAEWVAVVVRMKIGEWIQDERSKRKEKGKPLSPRAIDKHLAALRVFFRECQEWGWITRRFDPRRSFGTPRSVRALIGPDPRIISDDVWAKLLWAGLNLQVDDLPAATGLPRAKGNLWYPLEMVRAMVVVWLFAGLRRDEFRRLRVGCIRWQHEAVPVPGTEEVLRKNAICWLDVPIHKTGTAFTKAVDRVVGEAIEGWERVRPLQPAGVDSKTGEVVHYLFSYRGKQIGLGYLNGSLIPLLCRKGGVPEQDARGDITSHRARSTIASQLYNAKEPLSLFDLQEWLGHRLLSSTQHYAKKSPTKVAKAYEKAGYFERNLRMIEVLIDRDAIESGAAAAGSPWRFFDLGHGYCLYEFFDQCPHRMACACCSFYRPKGSTQAQLLEGKANLLHMLQEIPLSEEERAAVEDGITALEKLCEQLADVPTPAGLTPKEWLGSQQAIKTTISMEQVRRRNRKVR